MSVDYDVIFELFLNKIEEDSTFFNLYKLTNEEIIEVARKRAKVFLKEAFAYIRSKCSLDFQIEFDDELSVVRIIPDDISLTPEEIDIIANVMKEIYYQRDLSKLKAFRVRFSPTDLKSFSPAEERRTFVDMCKFVKENNEVMIDNYASRDRITGKLKPIDYALYGDV